MSSIEQVIKEAVEKGAYHKGHSPEISTNNEGVWLQFYAAPFTSTFHQSDIFLDPSFWQALGKARGWPALSRYKGRYKYMEQGGVLNYVGKWHRFIDHLAEGGETEQFFKNLV